MTGHRNGFRRCFVWIMLFCAGWSGAVLAAGPERPKARPGELIVCLRALASPDEPTGGVSTAGAAQAALAVRSAATIAADPLRPASLRALDHKFGLREGKPLFPPAVRKPKAGAAPTAPTAPSDEHGLTRTGTDANGLNNRAAHGAGAGPSSSPGSLLSPSSAGPSSSPGSSAGQNGQTGRNGRNGRGGSSGSDSLADSNSSFITQHSSFITQHSSFIIQHSSLSVLRFDPAVDLEAARKAYAADPNVLYAEPNWEGALCYVPSDPLYAETAADLAVIGMEEAWTVQPGCGGAVPPVVPPVVAVIDSGVEPYHPDLAPALDLANSWNFTDNNANVFDDLGHGTRVAGIIAAAGNNAEGIAGVAFGCRLLSLDVTTSAGVVTTADVASAINWAVARGADVVNMSLRFSGASQTLQNACDSAAAAGVLLVAAAGNENQGDLPVYPASYDSVIGVGAVMDDGAARAPFSNYNNLQKNLVELVAPGSTVFSTIPGSQYNGTYGSGTSFAAPMVSGVAALLKAHYPDQSAAAIRAHLSATCKRVGQAFQPANSAGAGLLDAKAALETPMTPEISVVSVAVDDNTAYDTDNDGDGALDKGEKARLIVTLSSSGADALNVTGTLSEAETDVDLAGNVTAAFGDVRHGASASNAADAFSTVTISAAAPVQDVTFSLALSGDGGFSDTLIFQLPIENEVTLSGVKNTNFTADKTYHVTGNLVIFGDVTIAPGTFIKVDSGVDVQVGLAGFTTNLTAVGTAENPIRFTSAKPYGSGSGAAGAGTSDPSNIGPKNVPVNLGAYQQVRYVSANTGSDTSGDGSSTKPWRTVQHALDQITGASGSTRYALLIAEGTYTGSGNYVVTMKEWVDLYGGFEATSWTRDVFAHVSTLDGENARGVVLGANNAGLDGFTVTRGERGSGSGGGVYCSFSSPTISNNMISGNSASTGGGIYCGANSSPTISNNAICANRANSGGGIYCDNSSPTISNNTISGNFTFGFFSGGPGGGICCADNSSPTISNNTLCANSASYGGGIYCGNSSPTISNNTICANSGYGYGGGISCYSSSPTISNNTICGNSADSNGGGIYCETNSSPTISNNTIRANVAIEGGGIYCYDSSPVILNTIIYDNSGLGSGDSIVNDGGAPILRYCDIEGGWTGAGGNNIDAPPKCAGLLAWGVVRDIQYHADIYQSILTAPNTSLTPDSLAGRFVRVGSYYYPVVSNTAAALVVWGDVTQEGTVLAPQTWEIHDYHLRSNSPCIGAGVGPANPTYGASVPVLDVDGEARSGLTCDIGADEYNTATAPFVWGRLWVTADATSVQFQHIVVENGAGLLNEGGNTSFSNCLLQRNTDYGLRSTSGTSPVSNTTATLNLGIGIDAPLRSLTGCAALYNGGEGLIGLDLANCRAYGSGADGLTGTSATDCASDFNGSNGTTLTGSSLRVTAQDNRGNGIVTSGGDVTDSTAARNDGVGVRISGGGTASDCTASGNGGGGVSTDGSNVTNCVVENNTGVGVTGSGASTVANTRIIGNTGAALSGVQMVTGCAVAGNAPGIEGAETVSGTYVGHNEGHGVSGGGVWDSTVVGNSGNGVNAPTALSKSWIVASGGFGVFSTGRTLAASGCSILNNGGIGAQDLLSLNSSNIYGNDWAGGNGIEMRDTVGTSGRIDFEGNWWGEDHAAEIAGKTYPADLTFAKDFFDASGSGFFDVWAPASGFLTNSPNSSAPAFLLSVEPNPANAVNVGLTTFTLTFSEAMETNPSSASTLAVSFGLSAPYTNHVVQPAPGWLPDGKTWRGVFSVQGDTGDGLNTIRVANARAADGFLIPDDTAHTFVIDTSGGGAANNGLAKALGSTAMNVSWTDTGKPAGALGFNIRRSASGTPGTYQKITAAAVAAVSYDDAGLQGGTTYFYIVDVVDANNNSTQWTPPFYGRTEGTPVPAQTKEWTLYE